MAILPNLSPPTTVLYIKHMVCSRGIRMVRQELEGLGLEVLEVRLGAATVVGAPQELDWPCIRTTLERAGFILLETLSQTLLYRVEAAVQWRLRQPECPGHRDFAEAVAQDVGLPYPRLSADFAHLSASHTLADYILIQRLAYAQELLASSELRIGRITRQLGYRSLAHFSGQFRRFAYCAPSTYRQQLREAKTAAAGPPATPNDASEQEEDAKPGA
ncbi:AraC family transcriptional regulator [Hymenobacter lapidiphilus]|uniref:helix-turn-helix domain-containing protein n=1 Tax=Hymenobacter sp. CCM 8763 TaxID=2303334 RepID=UPI000E3520DA|nr:AraC family transcriptional regulator [Hymenobacter sp. CCM 8763]RFP64010.1 AraC family transcriptional regulator [Hymenobacter sp. CCM 8763]